MTPNDSYILKLLVTIKSPKDTIAQIERSAKLGVDLVRVSVPDKESSNSLKEIVKHSPVPIIADIHFHYKRAIEAAENGADCLRINPGNIGNLQKIKEVIQIVLQLLLKTAVCSLNT